MRADVLPVMFSCLVASAPASSAPAASSDLGRPGVDYQLSARLDVEAKTVEGRGVVRFTNTTHAPTSELRWHLYLNAFRDAEASFQRESRGSWQRPRSDAERWGSIEVLEMRAQGNDLLAQKSFEQPDDGNPADATVLRTPLWEPLEPGRTLEIEVAFRSTLPPIHERSGYAGDFFFVAQWFPKLGVLRDGHDAYGAPVAEWVCHQYHAFGEFFSEYGRYRVEIDVPRGFEVGATGPRVETRALGDRVVVVHEQDRIHDFAFTADRRFVRVEDTFRGDEEVEPEVFDRLQAQLGIERAELSLSPVRIVLLVQPEHQALAPRFLRAAKATLKWMGLWYGAYPYEVLTLVDGPRTAEGAMGMEYPTLVAVGGRWPAPEAYPSPERVTVHEVAHQFWYGLVGSNETEEAWLDEGFTTYSTSKVLDVEYGPFHYAPSLFDVPLLAFFPGLKLHAFEVDRLVFLRRPDVDRVVHPSWRYRDRGAYAVNSYARPALALLALEAEVGSEIFARALRRHQQAHRFGHPDTEAFRAVVEAEAGRSLEAFFADHLRSTEVLDYAVGEVVSAPRGEGRFENRVIVERRGPLVRPVRVALELEDGTSRMEVWDGRDRHMKWVFEAPARVVAARLELHPLDANPANDARGAGANLRVPLAALAQALFSLETWLQLLGGFL